MKKVPERFIWAAELLNVNPGDHILEIGCGAGLLAEQIAGKLSKGQIIAVDRSAPMIEKAKKGNAEFIGMGLSKFLVSDFSKAEFPDSFFDSIIAFNVNFFWKSPERELKIIRQLLKRDGKLLVLYQAPFEININAAEPIKQNLLGNSFEILDIQLKKLYPTSAFCIISKPK